MADESTPAPAQDTPEPTAIEHAVVTNDYKAFEAAEFAVKAGKPLDHVPAAEPEKVAPTETPVLSKRQQDANERTRKAVEAATADLKAENDRLRKLAAPVARPVAEKTPAPAPLPDKFPSYAEFLEKTPDASLETWMDARDEWRDEQRSRTARERADSDTVEQAETERLARVAEQVSARATADPEFVKSLNPRLLQIETFADAGRNGREVGPSNVIAEELFKSEQFIHFLEHFTAHPDDLARLEVVPAHLEKLPARQRAAEHTRWIVREMGKIESTLAPATAAVESTPKPKTITTAPRPPADLGKRTTESADPVASAVKADDYAAFERAERARLQAQSTRR